MKYGLRQRQSERYFDLLAESYDSSEIAQGTRRTFDRFIAEIRNRNARSVLDVGCGTGELLKILSETAPEIRLWGQDISENMLAMAREKLAGRAEFMLGDSASIPLASESCDAICCNHSFHHYPHPLRVLREFRRLLAPGGVLMIGENYFPPMTRIQVNLDNLTKGQAGDVWMYSRRELCFLLSRHFGRVRYEKIDNRYCFIIVQK